MDVLDELQTFVAHRPAWVGKDGFPLSWQHFRYGLVHIARDQLREQLRLTQSWRLSQAKPDEFDEWQRDVARLTEVPKNG